PRTRATVPSCLIMSPSHLPPLCAVFFFSCSRDPPYLHSFPTRRSSDLRQGKPEAICRVALPHLSLSVKLFKKLHKPESPLQQLLDRKSTRLNSSHVSISYAVFCLKKKKPPGRGGALSVDDDHSAAAKYR